jgi:hypothetical protein
LHQRFFWEQDMVCIPCFSSGCSNCLYFICIVMQH